MSVRRLADASVQPAAFAFNKGMAAEAKTWINKYPKGPQQSAVIPLLMLAQEQEGWVTKAAIEHVAAMLEMPHIRVLEVATFYTQFQLKPVGTKAHIQVCGTTPCMIMGAEGLMDVCRSKIHHDQFHTNADGTLSWEEVECLGACVNAPMVMIFKDTYEDLTPERLAEIIEQFEAGKGNNVKTGPQIDRWFSAPATGFTSLADEKVLKTANGKAGKGSKPATLTAEPAVNVPPSNAARPKTYSDQTSAAVKSPSSVKASSAAESGASVKAPAHSARQANKASEAVEKEVKQRKPAKSKAGPAVAFASPELLKGAPIGASGKKVVNAAPEPKPLKASQKGWADVDEAAKRATKPTPAAVAKPSLDSKDRPKGIERPKAVDDLKLISGVGPKIERTLHDLGIFTYAQVASWKKSERDWVDSYLAFHGRIEREDWVKQAKALAKGGVAEYVRVFGRKPV
jgi:NADH-quinone oxidoreductase subunit E